MKWLNLFFLSLPLTLVIGLPIVSLADYTITTGSGTTPLATVVNGSSRKYAQRFTTIGAGTISSLDICIGNGATSIPISIWSDVSSEPGSSLTSGTISTLSSDPGLNTVTFGSPLSVTATTNYWLVTLPATTGDVQTCGISSTSADPALYANPGPSYSSISQTQHLSIPIVEGGGGGSSSSSTATTSIDILRGQFFFGTLLLEGFGIATIGVLIAFWLLKTFKL